MECISTNQNANKPSDEIQAITPPVDVTDNVQERTEPVNEIKMINPHPKSILENGNALLQIQPEKLELTNLAIQQDDQDDLQERTHTSI